MKRACHISKRTNSRHSMALGIACVGAVGIGLAALTASRLRQRSFSFKDKVVVITGGSRGLGLVIARQLVDEGAKLVLLARSEADLRCAEIELRQRAAGASVIGIPCDVTSQAEVEAAIGIAIEKFGRIDVLINNAGIMQVGPYEHMGIQDFDDAMKVHFWGPLFTMLEVIPHMRRQGDGGRIVNISSIAGKVATPHMAPYCASKFALVGLSDSMRSELAQSGIRVTTVCPWFMRTGSVYNVELKGRHQEEFAWFAAGASVPLLTVSAERAARKIIKACRNGSPRLVMAMWGKAMSIMNELAPRAMAHVQSFASRMMPEAELPRGDWSRTGWESRSQRLPALLTQRTWEAAQRNNELPQAIRSATAPGYEHSHLAKSP